MAPAPGTTVTLFGDSDLLGQAISDQLEQRGCKTHAVSVPTGWLRSATYAVMRLDTTAGAKAFEELAAIDQPRSHVIAVGLEPADPSEVQRVRDMCQTCGIHHDIALIWHQPLVGNATTHQAASLDTQVVTNALAATVANELVESSTGGPAFVSKPFRLGDDPH